jgi:hypothetical protein
MPKVNSPKLISKIDEATTQSLEIFEYYFVYLSIPCNIFLPFHPCMNCFAVDETCIF